MTVITTANEADMNFIFSSWLKSFQETEQNRLIPGAVYFRAQSALITDLLKSSTVLVARSPVDDLIIRGYAVGSAPELHWVYVKGVCRRQGIATALLDALGDLQTFTHAREPGAAWLRRIGLTYDGRLFGGREKEHETHLRKAGRQQAIQAPHVGRSEADFYRRRPGHEVRERADYDSLEVDGQGIRRSRVSG